MKKSELREIYQELFRYTIRLRDRALLPKNEAKDYVLDRAKMLLDPKDWFMQKILATFNKAWESERLQFFLNELGNGDRFIYQHGEDLRFCYGKGNWYIWDGKRWAEDNTERRMQKAKDTVNSIKAVAETLPEEDGYRKELLTHWKRSSSVGHLKAMINAARIERKISVRPEDLDTNKWLLNCNNGTIDLKNGTLLKHNRDDFITKLVPIDYALDAKCPTWLKFIYRSTNGDQDLIRFLQKVVGYTLTGATGEKCLFFIFGGTDTGKTTFIETIRKMMGDYAAGTDFQTFLYSKRGGGNIRNDIARLEGARFVSASEAGPGEKFDEVFIKQITGKDTMVARFLYKEYIEFVPELKVFLASNHLPKISDLDEAIWNRIITIPFNVRIPRPEQDPDLDKKLQAELPGILAWSVRGYLEYQRYGLQLPQIVLNSIKVYRSESDVYERFIQESFSRPESKFAKNSFTTSTALLEEWEKWCSNNAIDSGTPDSFYKVIANKGYERDRKRIDGILRRGYQGILLKSKISHDLTEAIQESINSRDEYKAEDSDT